MPTTDLFVIDDAARQHEMMISMGEKGNLILVTAMRL